MMKRPIQKAFAAVAATAVVSGMAVSAYAMTDADFKAQLLEELKIEAKLTAEEIEYVSQKIDDISRDDILTSLEEEIAELGDSELQSRANADLESLKGVADIDTFFDNLDEIYAYLDAYYEENGEMYGWEDAEEFEFNFEEEKAFILEEGREELQYIEDEALKGKVSDAIVELEAINDEDLFFDKLDEIYKEVDEYYGYDYEDYEWDEEEYDFDELKKEIIEELGEEENFIKDEALKAKFKASIAKLVDQDDEDSFFEVLDELYEDPDLDAYYESEGIEILMEEDFFDEDFDFASEREEILSEVSQELAEIDDADLTAELGGMIYNLSGEENEHVFFDTLDEIYEKIDSHYGIEWDDEDWEEYEDYDFASEREEIIAELQEELNYIEDETLRDQVLADITKLESLTDEDQFFDTLDEIYDEVDTYYDENEELWEDDEDEWDEDNEEDEEEDDE